MTDLDALRRNHPLPAVARSYGLDLELNGDEWKSCCPFHAEKTPSFTIFRGRKDGAWRFHCWSCDVKPGDVIDFVEAIKGVTKTEAIKIILGGSTAGANVTPVEAPSRDPYDGIEILDQPDGLAVNRKIVLYNPKRERSGNITPSAVYPYRRLDGSLIGYVLRHELSDGAKETPMVMWVRLPSGDECWSRFSFPKPRPLYGLHRIKDFQTIILVEGEKCADALANLRQRPVLSWPGGTGGIGHCDLSPLEGKDVVVWGDNDKPGWRVASDIKDRVTAIAARVRFIDYYKGAF